MNIIRAATDRNLLKPYLGKGDLSTWRVWFVFLKCVFGLPLDSEELEIAKQATGRTVFPSEGFSEVFVLAGRRSGKSKIAGLIAAYTAALGDRSKLSQGEVGMVATVSPTTRQSKIIHAYTKSCFDESELLSNELEATEKNLFKLRSGVECSILTGDPKSVRGFSLLIALVDELAAFAWSEEAVISDKELLRALRPALANTRGRLICISSPYAENGSLYQAFKRHWGKDDSQTLVWWGASTFMNPTLDQSVIDRAIQDDPEAASVEFAIEVGHFRTDLAAFIDRSTVEANVIPDRKELPALPHINYVGFCDLSGGRVDDSCLCIAHREGRIAIVDYIQRHKAPHNPLTAIVSMAEALKRYGCTTCTGDRYAAEFARQAFAQSGITLENSSKTAWADGIQAKNLVPKSRSQIYLEVLPRLIGGEVELLDDETLVQQFASLQRKTRSGGRDIVDHPQTAGSHDDVCNCVAGAIMLCFEKHKVILRSLDDTAKPDMFGQIDTNNVGSIALKHFDVEEQLYRQEMEALARGESNREVARQALQRLYPRSPRFRPPLF